MDISENLAQLFNTISHSSNVILGCINNAELKEFRHSLRQRLAVRKHLHSNERIFVRDDPIQLAQLPPRINHVEVVKLADPYFFGALLGNQRVGTLLMTNNDFAFAKRYNYSFTSVPNNNFLIGWDFDNHHWLDNSFSFGNYVDIYFPAHVINLHTLMQAFGEQSKAIPIGSLQWTLEFLEASTTQLLAPRESNLPIGEHGFYEKFTKRNEIVSSWARVSPDCTLNPDLRSYTSLAQQARLTYWLKSTTHLVVPSGGDLPARFFDALITRSCVLLPEDLRNTIDLLPIDDYDKHLVQFFDPGALTDRHMSDLIQLGIHRWSTVNSEDRATPLGRFKERLLALHITTSVSKMLDNTNALIGYT